MSTKFEYWQKVLHAHSNEFKDLTPDEVDEVAEIVLNAIDEELHQPTTSFYRMIWCMSSVEPDEKVLSMLRKLGFIWIPGRNYNYFEWAKFLTSEK